ncbi:hypothetical protein BN8_03667 [Fibrisoma limi BUZ 3]|uniref:Uncharacterized protein n=1 Tax=Fibrisoma limi BUZ 3 TaxID=1185876 RepID=I2GKR5_9BACT|nr:hypothetical protein [Fibrisoma limi]CCH54491.1 hypothetical protein BN8_03667 [Fibrisoma limi BUZ 3]
MTRPPKHMGVLPVDIVIEFKKRGYTGDPVEIRASKESTVVRETVDSSDSRWTPILAQKVSISLFCEEFWDFKDLYVETDDTYQVVITKNVGTRSNPLLVTEFTGWLLSDDAAEPYTVKPYRVRVSAICGLALLKSRPFVDLTGRPITGMRDLLDLLADALLQTGYDLPIVTADNLYELYDMASGQLLNGLPNPAYDPLKRTRIKGEHFTDDKNQPLSCTDVLKAILEARGARLTQWNGMWFIVRSSEVVGGWNPWSGDPSALCMRRYADATELENPLVEYRILKQTVTLPGTLRPLATAKVAYEPPLKKYTVKQDFGRTINLLPNGKFSASAGGFPTIWQRNRLSSTGTDRSAIYLGSGLEGDPYRVRIYGIASDEADRGKEFIYQQIRLPQFVKGQAGYVIKGKMQVNNCRGAMLIVQGQVENNPHPPNDGKWAWLKVDDKSWDIQPKKKDMRCHTFPHVDTVPGVAEGKPGWLKPKIGWGDFELEFNTNPFIRNIRICLCIAESLDGQTSTPTPWLDYADIRVERKVSDAGAPTGRYETRTQDNKQLVTTPEADLTITIGDVPDAADATGHLGTLYKPDGQTPASKWLNPNDVQHLERGGSMLSYAVSDRFGASIRAKQTWDGQLVGDLLLGPLSVPQFPDITGPDGPLSFQIVKWKQEMLFHKHTITAVEVIGEGGVQLIGKHWDTPSGPVSLEVDPLTGEPATTQSKLDEITKQIKKLLSPILPTLKFELGVSTLPGSLVPLDESDRSRYQLGVELSVNGKVIGNVRAIGRKINDLNLIDDGQ